MATRKRKPQTKWIKGCYRCGYEETVDGRKPRKGGECPRCGRGMHVRPGYQPNPAAPVTARRTKGGVVVSVKVKDLKTAKKVARRIGAR
jgi:hypothetical protein